MLSLLSTSTLPVQCSVQLATGSKCINCKGKNQGNLLQQLKYILDLAALKEKDIKLRAELYTDYLP
jgi:hypothetical protein